MTIYELKNKLNSGISDKEISQIEGISGLSKSISGKLESIRYSKRELFRSRLNGWYIVLG